MLIAGQEAFDKINKNSFWNANVFLLTFSLNKDRFETTFANVKDKVPPVQISLFFVEILRVEGSVAPTSALLFDGCSVRLCSCSLCV